MYNIPLTEWRLYLNLLQIMNVFFLYLQTQSIFYVSLASEFFFKKCNITASKQITHTPTQRYTAHQGLHSECVGILLHDLRTGSPAELCSYMWNQPNPVAKSSDLRLPWLLRKETSAKRHKKITVGAGDV